MLSSQNTPTQSSVIKNLKWGIANGIFFACFYSIIVGVVFLCRGSEPFARNGATIGRTIGLYFGAGVLAGAVVGLLRPIARNPLGAMAVGIPAAFVVFLGVGLVVAGMPTSWNRENWVIVAILTFFIGPLFGLGAWYHAKSAKERYGGSE